MFLLLVGTITAVLVCIILIALLASAKEEDKLREASYQQYLLSATNKSGIIA